MIKKNRHRYFALLLSVALLFSITACNRTPSKELELSIGNSATDDDNKQNNTTNNPPATSTPPPSATTPGTPDDPVTPTLPDDPIDPPVEPELPPETPFITLSNVPLDVNKGDLILVNRTHTYDASMAATDLVLIKKALTDPALSADIVLAKYEMYLTAKTVDALARLSHDMQTTLGSDKNIHIYSAYRDNDYQQSIIDDYLSRPGYGQSYVDNYVAPVGASEHHTGMAVDINFYADNGGSYRFDDAAVANEYAWILAHAHEYGLIWRYTDEKKDITGYNEEIWHFRYVGTPHAEYIKENEICFEEYHTLIEKATFDNPLIITTSEGNVYSIYADAAADGLQVPQSLVYTVSGSNCGYYIVTVEGSYKGAGIIYADSSGQVELPLAPDIGEKYTGRLTFLADSQIYTLKDTDLLPPNNEKIGRVWCSATENKLNFKFINTLAVMVDTDDSDRYWVSNTIAKTAENFTPDLLVLSIGLDGGINREYALTDSESTDIWRTLITSILKASPKTVIILQSVLPLGINAPESYGYTTNDAITRFNSTMLHIATELHAETGRVFYLNTASVMADASGYLKTSYSDDGVTLNYTGLSAMMHYIRTHPYVK